MHAQRLNLAIRMAVAIAVVWTIGSPAAHAQALAKSDSTAAYRDGTIKVDGRTIHYLDWGPEGKPAFILVHALGHSAHNYDHVAPLLNQRHRVIAIDLRGHGDSDWSPKGEYSVEDYVSDLPRFGDAVEAWASDVDRLLDRRPRRAGLLRDVSRSRQQAHRARRRSGASRVHHAHAQ
jgi:hypothetical protein